MRLSIIGNAGGGKSTLGRRIAEARALPFHELDALLWKPGWVASPETEYEAAHARIIAGNAWIVDGLGRRESIPQRLHRSTHILLVDMPLWQHFWLAAERQMAWSKGELSAPPGRISDMPPTRGLFETIWTVDRDWMPDIRHSVTCAEASGRTVIRIGSADDLADFSMDSL